MSKPVPVKSSGSFLSGGRIAPRHGYTTATISHKRFRENTSSLAVTINFILPTLQSVNRILEKHVTDGTDVPADELLGIFLSCSEASAKSYADRLARVACQTAFACILIRTDTPVGNTMVYLWDLYPRLMQRYVGEIFDLVRVPRFLKSLLGAAPSADDVAYLRSPATAADAFTASLQRNCVLLVGDVVVDTVRVAADRNIKSEQKPVIIVKKVFARCTTCVCWAAGAAVGRAVGGERGEYWGEFLGTVVAPTVVVEVLTLAGNVTKTRTKGTSRHRPSSSSARSSWTAAEGGPRSAVPATA